jgi:4-diphosphocytidyl-2-C-methyl-D-erythritol kinase
VIRRPALVLPLVLLLGACGTVPVSQVNPEAAYQARSNRLTGISEWQFTARLSMDDGVDGGSGRLQWHAMAQSDRLDFQGALGRGAWRLSVTPAGALLEKGDGSRTRAPSVDQLASSSAAGPLISSAISRSATCSCRAVWKRSTHLTESSSQSAGGPCRPGAKRMAERFVWPAPAKLNLFLHITGRRADGYHELQTLYQLLDWGDRLSIETRPDGVIRRSSGPDGVAEQEDLAIRAAHRLKEAAGGRLGATIGIRKHIPAGAGLGGGSSDAATVLLVLNRLWGCGLSQHELARIGLSLGADVPVFVHGRSAWGEGIGERLQALELGDRHYVLLFPGVRVATAGVFADPQLRRDTPPIKPAATLPDSAANDCEAVVLARHPEIAAGMRALAEYGQPRLTGTGSCIFLAARDESVARSVTSRLKSRYNVRAVRGVDRSPLMQRLLKGN